MEITKSNREWLVAKYGNVSICISVEDGSYNGGLIHGINGEAMGVCLPEESFSRLKNLKDALDEILPEITKAMVRTKPELEKET